MKKLIIVAAAAAMFGGAYAADDCTTECAYAYKIKAIVKTTQASALSNATTCVAGCYRKPAVRRYIGYMFGNTTKIVGECTTGCGCIEFGDIATSRIAIWNFDTKEAVTPNATLRLADRIGKDDTSRCEIVFDTMYWDQNPLTTEEGVLTKLTFAGFGDVERMASGQPAIKRASGFCAGTVPGVCATCDTVCGVVDPSTCTVGAANVWRICGTGVTSYVTAAFGKWKMLWDAEMANRVTTKKAGYTLDVEAEHFVDTGAYGFTPAGYATGVAKAIAIAFEDNGITE